MWESNSHFPICIQTPMEGGKWELLFHMTPSYKGMRIGLQYIVSLNVSPYCYSFPIPSICPLGRSGLVVATPSKRRTDGRTKRRTSQQCFIGLQNFGVSGCSPKFLGCQCARYAEINKLGTWVNMGA